MPWINPSRVETYYDSLSGRHIGPGEVLASNPHPNIEHKLVHIHPGQSPVVSEQSAPVTVMSQVQESDVNDPSDDTPRKGRKK